MIRISEILLGTGRVLNHDPKSREFPAPQSEEIKTILHNYSGPVMQQGKTNSCTGQTLIHYLNTDFGKAARQAILGLDSLYFTEKHAFQIYELATSIDEFPGQMPDEDTGSSSLAVMKAGQRLGYLKEYRHAFGIEEIVKTLQFSPVMIGTLFYEGMFHPDENGFVTIQNSADAGGHEYLLLGVDLEKRYFTFLSSWGKDWGQNGMFKLAYDEFAELISYQGDACVPIPV